MNELSLAVALEESEGRREKASSCQSEQDDGMAVCGLGPGWGGGGVVQALGAALGMG